MDRITPYSWELADAEAIRGNTAVSVCYQLGIMSAIVENGQLYFRSELPLSHEEMVALVAKAAAIVGHPPADLETFEVTTPPLLRHQAAQILLDVMQQNGLTMIPVSGTCREYTIAQGVTIIAPEGKTVTMTVDGVETPMVPGTYRGTVVLTVE